MTAKTKPMARNWRCVIPAAQPVQGQRLRIQFNDEPCSAAEANKSVSCSRNSISLGRARRWRSNQQILPREQWRQQIVQEGGQILFSGLWGLICTYCRQTFDSHLFTVPGSLPHRDADGRGEIRASAAVGTAMKPPMDLRQLPGAISATAAPLLVVEAGRHAAANTSRGEEPPEAIFAAQLAREALRNTGKIRNPSGRPGCCRIRSERCTPRRIEAGFVVLAFLLRRRIGVVKRLEGSARR